VVRLIVEHNRLNGIMFSTVEFLVVSLVAMFVAFGFAVHHAWVGVVLAAGIAVNCLVVVGFGVAAWRRGERGQALTSVFSRQGRREISREHPTMGRDTAILATAAVVPYALFIAVLLDPNR
jgi:hypothetical protein